MSAQRLARVYRVRGRVQGVGYRYFVQRAAHSLGLTGWVRNLDDGDVEVYAAGNSAQLSELAGMLWKGPQWAEVRAVDESEAPLEQHRGFFIKH